MTENGTTLRIERLVAASAASLFRAWTTREAMETWYRDRPDDIVRVVALDVRVGGHYRVEFGPFGEPPYVEWGEYREIDAPHRLVMSESLDGPDGTLWSDTTVTVTLTAEGDRTRLVLLHERFPTTDARNGAASGWPGFLDRIEIAAAQPSH
jgi:uncharacterized protein YndB with AHSA1/START domain